MSITSALHRNAGGQTPALVERFLRDRESIWQQISSEYQLAPLIRQMCLTSLGGLACFGAIMGSASGNPLQILAAALKLPILFLLTLAVCMPTFYLFNLLYGGRMTIHQGLAMILAAMTTTSVFVVAFTPITLFFRFAAWDYAFFILFNYAILAISSLIGLKFLILGLMSINDGPGDPADDGALETLARPARGPLVQMQFLYLWFFFSSFIGVELLWSLQPLFGTPGQPFELFTRPSGGIFASRLLLTLAEFF